MATTKVDPTSLKCFGKMIRDFPAVREVFIEDPGSCLEKYVGLNLGDFGVSRADIPKGEELQAILERQVGQGLTSDILSIAVCAVVV